MTEKFPIENLDLVGYATRLLKTMVPAIVSPIFALRDKDDDVVVFPPFTIYQGFVRDGALSTQRELRALARKGEVTLVDEPLAARDGYELWVDLELRPQYAPMADVRAELQKIAETQRKAADDALEKQDLESVERHASIAGCADSRQFWPYALKAALRQRQDKEAAARVMKRLAEGLCPPTMFDSAVKDYLVQLKARAPVMHDVAKKRPAKYIASSWLAAA